MPPTCGQARRACCPDAEMPRSLNDVSTVVQVEELGLDIEALALLGTQFADALITTRNDAALVSGRGGYGRVQPTGSALSVNGRRVSLRYARSAPLALARAEAQPLLGRPGAIMAVDGNGLVHHRAQFNAPYDQRVAQSVEPEPGMPLTVPDDMGGNVVSLAAVRQARDGWPRACAARHLDDLLIHGAGHRLACLPHVGRDRAWRIALPMVPGLLRHLFESGRSFTRAVCGPGVMQFQTGALTALVEGGNMVIARMERDVFSLDLNSLGQAWVVASPAHWQIELFDGQGAVAAVLMADPMSDAGAWRDRLACLPRAS